MVNNHAVQYIKRSILDITPGQLPCAFQTNVFSYFYLIQAAFPHMGRGGTALRGVAPCHVFLASNDASYMTGQVLHPNGGTIVGS